MVDVRWPGNKSGDMGAKSGAMGGDNSGDMAWFHGWTCTGFFWFLDPLFRMRCVNSFLISCFLFFSRYSPELPRNPSSDSPPPRPSMYLFSPSYPIIICCHYCFSTRLARTSYYVAPYDVRYLFTPSTAASPNFYHKYELTINPSKWKYLHTMDARGLWLDCDMGHC